MWTQFSFLVTQLNCNYPKWKSTEWRKKQEKNERSQHRGTLSLRHISPDFGRASWKESASRTWQRTARCGPAATGGLQLNARSTFFHSFCPCHRAEDRGRGKRHTSVYRLFQSDVAFAWEAYCVFRLEEDVVF